MYNNYQKFRMCTLLLSKLRLLEKGLLTVLGLGLKLTFLLSVKHDTEYLCLLISAHFQRVMI